MYKRKIVTLLLIFTKFSIMFKNVDSSNTHPCPAAYVGESYQLHCSEVNGKEESLIVWTIEDKNNQYDGEVSRCYFNSTCFTQNTCRFYVNATSSWKSPLFYNMTSTYTILKVTEDDRDTVITCTAIYHTSSPSKSEKIMTCKLPVLTVPPSCQASLYMPDVSIVCNFPKVNPKVKCEFGYEKNVFQPEVENVVKAFTHTFPDYYNITCSGLLKFEAPYQTRYYVRFTPIYLTDMKEDGDKNQSRVEEVTLTMSPELVINSPPYITNCPPSLAKNVSVYCSVTSMSRRVSLDLFVDNVKVIPQKPPTYISSQLYITMQEYTLQVDTHFPNRSLRCESEGFSYDSAQKNLPIPPNSNPLFTLDGGMVVDNIHVIPENVDSKLSITCRVKNSISLGSNIIVVCSFPNGNRYLKKNSSSNFVFFTINGEDLSDKLVCNCSAHQDSDCYTNYTILTISVKGDKENQTENENESILIAVSVICVIELLILFGCCYKHYNCCRKRGSKDVSVTYSSCKFVDIIRKIITKTKDERHTENERLNRAEGGAISDIQTEIDSLKLHRESQDINFAMNTEQHSDDILTPVNPSSEDC